MQMKLVLHNGPIIPRVQSVSLDTDALAITFLTPTAASIAHLVTGWPFTTDDRTLLAALHPLVIHPPQDPAASRRSIAGWTLVDDSAPAVQ
jgi:hypothetical protein